MTVNLFSLDFRNPLQEVLSFTDDLSTLYNFSLVCKAGKKAIRNELIWKVFAEKLHILKSSNSTFYQSVKKHVLNLKPNILKFPSDEITNDIKKILEKKAPRAFKDLELLSQFSQARDTIIVWKKLAKEINVPVDFTSVFDGAANTIEKANEFSNWVNQNQAAISQIQVLDFSKNQLTSIPREIEKLTSLQKLYLSYNQLTSIPREIENLTFLKALFLNNNQLTSIPREIKNLTFLKVLFLSNNQFKSILREIGGLTSLELLFLNNNQLTSIPRELGNILSLELLFLNNNQLISIPRELGNLPSLRKLSLENNKLSRIPFEIFTFGSFFSLIPRIKVRYGGNPVSLIDRIEISSRQLSKFYVIWLLFYLIYNLSENPSFGSFGI